METGSQYTWSNWFSSIVGCCACTKRVDLEEKREQQNVQRIEIRKQIDKENLDSSNSSQEDDTLKHKQEWRQQQEAFFSGHVAHVDNVRIQRELHEKINEQNHRISMIEFESQEKEKKLKGHHKVSFTDQDWQRLNQQTLDLNIKLKMEKYKYKKLCKEYESLQTKMDSYHDRQESRKSGTQKRKASTLKMQLGVHTLDDPHGHPLSSRSKGSNQPKSVRSHSKDSKRRRLKKGATLGDIKVQRRISGSVRRGNRQDANELVKQSSNDDDGLPQVVEMPIDQISRKSSKKNEVKAGSFVSITSFELRSPEKLRNWSKLSLPKRAQVKSLPQNQFRSHGFDLPTRQSQTSNRKSAFLLGRQATNKKIDEGSAPDKQNGGEFLNHRKMTQTKRSSMRVLRKHEIL